MAAGASPLFKIPTKTPQPARSGTRLGQPALLAKARDHATRRGQVPCCAGMPARPCVVMVVWWWSWSAG